MNPISRRSLSLALAAIGGSYALRGALPACVGAAPIRQSKST
jgi:hypothetical protein